jgi:adenine-specific DNA-methyltransferase
MADNIRWGLDNPHPFSQMKTELIWEGKYDEYGNRRAVDIAGSAMPLQKIETVDQPRSEAAASGQIELFEKENKRLDDFRNMLIWGDNKLIMASLLKDYKGKIDLIYIDPPFDVGADFTMNVPVGDGKETLGKDQSALEMVAYRDMWGKGTDSYLHMMHERLVLMREFVSENGSIYVHCDWRVVAFLRQLLDEIFGPDNLTNQIVRQKTRSPKAQSGSFGNIHDYILFCSKNINKTFNPQYDTRDEKTTETRFPHVDEQTGRRYVLDNFTQAGQGLPRNFGDKLLKPPAGKHWIWTQERIDKGLKDGLIAFTSKGMPRLKRFETVGVFAGDIWYGNRWMLHSQSLESTNYSTQKPEAILERILMASTNEGDLVADFFCGSGTTGAVAEKLGRRWIMADLGRFAIHTSRKRLIQLQRTLHKEGKQYRSFDVYNLGRYERQWWQKERLEGADEEHRRVVMDFYRAEHLPNAAGLLHGRKGRAFVHVDGIDSIFTRDELRSVVKAAKEAGAREVHCLAWEFEMDLRFICHELEAAHGIKIKLIPIPREIMEKNRTSPPPFLEMAVLEAEPVYRSKGGKRKVDIKLTKFLPSLAEVPSKELDVLKDRAMKSGFDFIDFWAVDFDWHKGKPFEHNWQDFRTRKDRALKTVSDFGYDKYSKKGKYIACVKVIDVFGCDTSITVKIVL